MRVIIHLGEPFWREVGQREVVVELPPGATVAGALEALSAQHPPLARQLNNGEAQPACFVNDEMVSFESCLSEGAVLHVVWPVSGG